MLSVRADDKVYSIVHLIYRLDYFKGV